MGQEKLIAPVNLVTLCQANTDKLTSTFPLHFIHTDAQMDDHLSPRRIYVDYKVLHRNSQKRNHCATPEYIKLGNLKLTENNHN